MTRILILLFSFYATLMVAQNVNHSQILFDMLMRDECFKSLDYERQYHDSIVPEVKLMYKYKMNGFLNRPDSSALYFERMIQECPTLFPNEVAKLGGINTLLNLYTELGNFEKVIEFAQVAEQIIINPPFNENSGWQQKQLSSLSIIKSDARNKSKIPEMQVSKLESDEIVDIRKELLITAPVECNGILLDACIDTGWQSHLLITKKIADKCNITNVTSTIDSISLNGTLVRADMVLVDSMKLGSILFENIPACVVYDEYLSFLPDSVKLNSKQIAKFDSISTKFEFIIGLPLLRMLGSLEFDFDKDKMYLKMKSDIPLTKKKNNLFIANNTLYAYLNINSIDFVGFVDTGAGNFGISLNPLFYENHSESILIDSLMKGEGKNMYGISSAASAKYQSVLNPVVLLNSKQVVLEKDDIVIWSTTQPIQKGLQWRDGLIGCSFIKKLGSKVKFDFVNMKIIAE